MRKLFLLFSVLVLSLSCSSDETSTPSIPTPTPTVKFTITLAAGEGGTVSTTGGEYESGQTVSVTATPQGEYLFKNWSDGNTNATRTITVLSNTTLTANFEKKKYPLTVNIEGEGEVIEEIVNTGRTTDYDSGTIVKLTAQPENEWVFSGWSGDIGDIDSTENPIQLNLTESKNVTATFINEINNYFKIGEHFFSIDRVTGDNYLNSITCDGIPSFFNHDLTFYSDNDENKIYIEFFNNNSDQLLPGDYTSLFSYLNLYFQNNFNDLEGLKEHIDTLSNQELYDFYSTLLCSNNNYKLVGAVEVISQDIYYEIDKEINFELNVDLSDEKYTINMTGFIEDGGEKIELIFTDYLDFEIKNDYHQPDEINDLLSLNDQNENSFDLNILYDSNYNLDGTFKLEESKISSSRPLYLINDNLLYFLRSVNSSRIARLFTSNNNYLDFDADDGDPFTYPDLLEGNIIQSDDGYFDIFLIDSENPPIYKFGKRKLNNNRLESLSEITVDLTNFGPDEYFSKSFTFSKISSDNLNNLFLNVDMRVQDLYGEVQNSTHFIKYNPTTQEIIWSINHPSNYLGSLSKGFFNNKQNIIFYGFDESNFSTWFKIYNSNTGELIYEDTLTEFISGGIVVNGFYEDTNHLILYGEYGFTYVINKSSFINDIMYTYTYGNSDYCGDYPTITGVNKFNENYVFLSNVQKNDENEGMFSIDIRDNQGNLLNSFSINNTGTPQHLFKLTDGSFLIVGSKEMCIKETLGPRSRIIKFKLTETKNNNVEKSYHKFLNQKK